jgi:hypothetical protein
MARNRLLHEPSLDTMITRGYKRHFGDNRFLHLVSDFDFYFSSGFMQSVFDVTHGNVLFQTGGWTSTSNHTHFFTLYIDFGMFYRKSCVPLAGAP